jgi:hypothetical protein
VNRRALGLVAAALGAASAGCTNSPPATFTGTIHGQTVTANDAISGPVTVNFGSTPVSAGAAVITNGSGVCNNLSQNPPKELKNSTYFAIILVAVNGTTASAPTTAGTYTFYSGTGTPPEKLALVLFDQTDAQCKTVQATTAAGTSGTVTLTGLNGSSYSGTFDVTMTSGDHVTGSFNATGCAALGTIFQAQTVCT